MGMKTLKALLIVLLMVALLYSPPPSFSCGPDFERVVFTHPEQPDFPLEQFAQGRLGILQPTYARSYLYVAYRYFTGTGFNEKEREAVLSMWEERLSQSWPSPGEGIYRRIKGGYSEYLNCHEDAFRTAERTLNERTKLFGANSPEVREWRRAQQLVFNNCSGGKAIPEPAGANAHPIIRADRAYQIAAAHFYAGDFDVAAKMFQELARDPASPWREVAAYVAARALLRKAVLRAEDPESYKSTLAQAEAQLKTVLGDKRMSAIHPAAKRLLGMVLFRLRPAERLRELSQPLLKPHSEATLKQDLIDYTLLLDRTYQAPTDDELTEWILTFQDASQEAVAHAVKQWTETASLPWLVASLSKIGGDYPKLAQFIAAAEKVKPSSPAFPTVTFHRLRLLEASGRKKEARQALDDLLARGKAGFPPSSVNMLLALRMKLASHLDEFLKYAQRAPAAYTSDLGPVDPVPGLTMGPPPDSDRRIDMDAANILSEKIPLSVLKDAVKSRELSGHLRRELVQAAWVKAVLLDDGVAGKELTLVLEGMVPALKKFLAAYRSAEDSQARKFAGVFAVLRFPGLRPYVEPGLGRETSVGLIANFRDNWWCALNKDAASWGYYHYRPMVRLAGPLAPLYPSGDPDPPAFLDEGQKAAAKVEWERLAAMSTGPNYLCEQVLRWARKNPRDPRVPEALHLAVRSTRYGCTDTNTTKLSRAAFQLLHQRYPNSPWAARTPYWF